MTTVLKKEQPHKSVQHGVGFKKFVALDGNEPPPPDKPEISYVTLAIKKRQELGIKTQKDLAQKVGCDVSYIQRFEKCESFPPREIFNKIRTVLNLPKPIKKKPAD